MLVYARIFYEISVCEGFTHLRGHSAARIHTSLFDEVRLHKKSLRPVGIVWHARSVSRLRILVIDDDQHVGDYLQELLTPDGCEVVTIQDPEEGYHRLKTKESFHILILDLRMPGVGGLELLERIRKIDRDIAVIILTAFPSLETATDAINLDVSAYIQKPFLATNSVRSLLGLPAKKASLSAVKMNFTSPLANVFDRFVKIVLKP